MTQIAEVEKLTVTETICDPLWQVTLWPGVTRSDLPATPGRLEDGIARIGPQNWIGFSEQAPQIGGDEGAVLDLAHSRKCFRIEGPRAREVMMRLAPLDFRDGAFADGEIKATSAHHISVWIARDGEAWDIYAGYTFAGGLREVIEETAAQWGA